jgi:hypothetical protein
MENVSLIYTMTAAEIVFLKSGDLYMNKPNPNQIMVYTTVESLFIDERHIDSVIQTLDSARYRYPDSMVVIEMEYDMDSDSGHPSVVLKSQRFETPEEAKIRYENEVVSYQDNEAWERKQLAILKSKYEGNDG